METICDALSLCRLESGITERIVHYYDESIKCPRIRIKENSKRNKYIIFYLLENRVVSSDFKLSFVLILRLIWTRLNGEMRLIIGKRCIN